MKAISFVWDGTKAESNLKKHKISFEEAQTVFSDPNARMIFDPGHSGDEDRLILLGISSGLRLLVVCHCYIEDDMVIRIISARKANEKRTETIREFPTMRKEYDFSKSVKNPYAKHLKKQVTLRLGIDVIDYFKKLAEETGVPYQNLINLYLQDCAHSQKKLRLKWAP